MKSRAVTAHRLAAAISLAGLTVAALAACNSAGSTGSSAGASAPPIVTTPAPSASAPPATPPPSGGSGSTGCPKNLVVPSSDNSRTLCVAVGGTVTITATPDQAKGWLPFDSTGSALTVATSTPAATGSAKVLAAYTAAAPGTSTISSSHKNCPSPAPGTVGCHSIVVWQVTITVK